MGTTDARSRRTVRKGSRPGGWVVNLSSDRERKEVTSVSSDNDGWEKSQEQEGLDYRTVTILIIFQ